ncbi:membrane-spanning protein [Neobacillus ginsengisoli]|uniref:Na+/melibiose symporter-like transporter n=1 Tax=Neobacillus ginsengisoli TaxID=904295 RepID=A0ABT9XY42_9BACI|nr:membrane-spanning protein [Neobacillus ginsengisoli]MDQ0199844.1 Na+/melibiose symporter-like transporter [Neobacillus ginsengisoli]
MKKKTIIILSIVFVLLFTGFFIFYLIKGDSSSWQVALGGMMVSPIPASLLFFKKNPFNLLIIIGYYFTLVYSAILGSIANFYYRYTWWDTSLHAYKGMYMAFVSIAIYKHFIPNNIQKNISRWVIFLFVLSLPVMVSVLWEIYEFVGDQTFTHTMQEGGNKDTMIDLISSTVSALLVAIYSVCIKRRF